MAKIKKILTVAVCVFALLSLLTACAKTDKLSDAGEQNVATTTATKEFNVIEFAGFEWLVLEQQNGKSLIVTKDVVDMQPYDNNTKETKAGTTWKTCTLRKYLNKDFLNSLDAKSRTRIASTILKNPGSPIADAPGGADTEDKIFILSLDEVLKYFGDSGKLASKDYTHIDSKGTSEEQEVHYIDDQYNNKRIAKLNMKEAQIKKSSAHKNWQLDDYSKKEVKESESTPAPDGWKGADSYWILRTPGESPIEVMAVEEETGFIDLDGILDFEILGCGIRPALWLSGELPPSIDTFAPAENEIINEPDYIGTWKLVEATDTSGEAIPEVVLNEIDLSIYWATFNENGNAILSKSLDRNNKDENIESPYIFSGGSVFFTNENLQDVSAVLSRDGTRKLVFDILDGENEYKFFLEKQQETTA